MEDEDFSPHSSLSLEEECILEIIKILQLDHSIESKMIANKLMIEGRQGLLQHKDDVLENVFENQMNGDQSELLHVLKVYNEQRWQQQISEEWFHQFLNEQKEESKTLYDQILTRTAEHCLMYIKNNALLSLTIRFLFKLDDQTIDNDDLFNQIWNSLISEGYPGMEHYKNRLPAQVLEKQLVNNQNPLYSASTHYFREMLTNFFNQTECDTTEVLEIALDYVVNRGLWFGLHESKFTRLIPSDKLQIITKELVKYLTSLGLSIPNQPSFSGENFKNTTKEEVISSATLLSSLSIQSDFASSITSARMDTRDSLIFSQEITEKIERLKQTLIETATNESTAQRCLIEYLEFVRLCELKSKLVNVNLYANDADIYDIQREIVQLEDALQISDGHNASPIYQLFLEILQEPNMLECLVYLSSEFKQRRAQLSSASDAAEHLSITKYLSLEVLWRNIIVCSRHQTMDVQRFLHQQYYQYIQAGFPFEIVDGDNLSFPYSFLFEALQPFRNHQTLVISIIGSRNTKRNILLNSMFGTHFDVRCTRGIYGSFIKTNRSDFQYILLIDADELSDAEREEPQYDRRIVTFCLAVSHIIIVDEVHSTLQSILTLGADSLKRLSVPKIAQPIVHLIFGENTNLNIENNQTNIDQMIADLKRFDLDDSIDIRADYVHTLLSAFKMEAQTLESNSRNLDQTSPELIEHLRLLGEQIIHSVDLRSHQSDELLDPLQWLSSSKTIFDILDKFLALTLYQDNHERCVDNDIRDYLTKIFLINYYDQFIRQSSHKSEQEIDDLFRCEQKRIKEAAKQYLENLFQSHETSEVFRRKYQANVPLKIMEMFNAMRILIIAANEKEKVKSLIQNGAGDLEKLIDDIIQNKQTISSENASVKFDLMFNNISQCIESKFLPDQRLKQTIKYVYANYNTSENEYLCSYGGMATHFPISFNLNVNRVTLDQVKDQLITYFTHLSSRTSLVTNHSSNSRASYSLEVIDHRVYLNKKLIKQDFLQSINEVSSSPHKPRRKDPHQQHDRNIRPDQSSKQIFPGNTAQFQLNMRNATQQQQSVVDQPKIFLRVPKVFREVIARLVKIMEGTKHNVARYLPIELTRAIVNQINLLVTEIDQELAPFCLSLSRPFKSKLHECAIIWLIKYSYDEQHNDFNRMLSQLQAKKDQLRKYFISIVIPDVANEERRAIDFMRQFQKHFIKEFNSNAQAIVKTELKIFYKLNRKWLFDRCNEQLLTKSDDRWYFGYIKNPIKIIEQHFEELWKHIQQEINRKLSDLKCQYVQLVTDFFLDIQG